MKSIINLLAVALTASQQSGGGLRSLDLFATAPIPNQVAIAIKLTTNGTAPGSGKTVTAHYALATQSGLSVAQLSECDAEQVLALPNAINTTREYTLPTIICGQRFLYVWFDNDALAGGAALTVTPIINVSN